MSKGLTPQEIEYINEVYLSCHNYSQTAKVVGRAASTVKKYVDPNYASKAAITPEETEIELPPLEEIADELPPWYDLTCLTPQEEEEIKQLWKEIMV